MFQTTWCKEFVGFKIPQTLGPYVKRSHPTGWKNEIKYDVIDITSTKESCGFTLYESIAHEVVYYNGEDPQRITPTIYD